MTLTQITEKGIKDGEIVNADINASAAIAKSKLETFVNNNADNRVITGSGTANTLEGESGLLFDGTDTLEIGTAAGGSGYDSNMKLRIGRASDAQICIRNTSGDTNYGGLIFGDNSSSFGGGIQYHHNGNSLRFYTDGSNERARIDSSGRVMIGTDTEGHASADDLTIATSGSTGITIRSGASSEGNIYFSDGTSGNSEFRGLVSFDHNTNKFQIQNNGNLGLSIDSSGNVGIGSTSPSEKLSVNGSIGLKDLRVLGDNANLSFYLTSPSDWRFRTTSGAERMRIHSNGRVSIGTTSADSRLHLKSPDGGNAAIILDQTQDAANYQNGIDFKNAGTQYAGIVAGKDASNNSLGLVFHTGTSYTERLRVQAGGGISFNGDTSAANALDDYEEGSFTPNWQGSSYGGTTNYTYNYGNYTKIGNTVHIRVYTELTSTTASGSWVMHALPFTSANDLGGITTGSCMLKLFNFSNNHTWVVPYKNSNSSYLYFYASGDDRDWNALEIGNDSSFSIILGITYRAA